MSPREQGTTIRVARLEDAGPIAALSVQLGYQSSADQVRKRLAIVVRSAADVLFVAIAAERGVIGWIHAVERQLVTTECDVQIEGLVVDEAWRRKGVGQMLLRTAEEWALLRGHKAIRVRSNIVRPAAHEFYRKAGYVEVKRQVVYRRALDQD